MIYTYNNKYVSFSRENRKNQTEAEKLLWRRIRNRQIDGYKFQRQFPVYNYILDFYCHDKKVAIELDGSQHIGKEYDKVRDTYLRRAGIIVMRFMDNEVLQNINGVLEKVLLELNK